MPELPEVENIRLQLAPLQGAKVRSVRKSNFALRYDLTKTDLDSLPGKTLAFNGVHRLGRHLFMFTSHGCLSIHLGMTGALHLSRDGSRSKQAHDHVELDLVDAGGRPLRLIYNDPRRFGGVELLPFTTIEQLRSHWNLGYEPTAPISAELLGKAYNSAKPIKAMLMDNALVTGIGNIYAAEVCFHARLAPTRPGSSLAPAELEMLSASIYATMAKAIADGGSTFRNYAHVDGGKGGAQMGHCVYGRGGGPCPRCATPIATMTQAGRTTFFCPNCQQ